MISPLSDFAWFRGEFEAFEGFFYCAPFEEHVLRLRWLWRQGVFRGK